MNIDILNCLTKILFLKQIEFTCSSDADCHQGYCENKKCYCLDGFNLKEDCSVYGCKSTPIDTIDNVLTWLMKLNDI